jgi:hypothetical protein
VCRIKNEYLHAVSAFVAVYPERNALVSELVCVCVDRTLHCMRVIHLSAGAQLMTARGSAESAIKTIEEGEEHTSNISTEREILKRRRSEREGCALAHHQVYRPASQERDVKNECRSPSGGVEGESKCHLRPPVRLACRARCRFLNPPDVTRRALSRWMDGGESFSPERARLLLLMHSRRGEFTWACTYIADDCNCVLRRREPPEECNKESCASFSCDTLAAAVQSTKQRE